MTPDPIRDALRAVAELRARHRPECPVRSAPYLTTVACTCLVERRPTERVADHVRRRRRAS